tara:strand:- start:322 stop:735 length:414 start_codon:yes stop_codon:yes gene_type:complete
MQRSKTLPPKQNRASPQSGRCNQNEVIDQASKACAVLQQTAAAQHNRINRSDGRDNRLKRAPIHPPGRRTELMENVAITGCDQQPAAGWKILEQNGEQRIVTKIFFAVITAEQERRSGTINHRRTWNSSSLSAAQLV